MAEMVRPPERPSGEWILNEEEIKDLMGETAAARGGVGELAAGGLVAVLPFNTNNHTQYKQIQYNNNGIYYYTEHITTMDQLQIKVLD